MAVEITEEFVWQNIPPRARDSHKGTFGSVLAVAGSAFYRGAALLAAEGALRTGAPNRLNFRMPNLGTSFPTPLA